MKHVLGRDVRADDFFVVSILNHWTRHFESKTADLISDHIKSSSLPTKRKRTNSPKSASLSSTAEHALAHLNHLRQQTRNSTSCESNPLSNFNTKLILSSLQFLTMKVCKVLLFQYKIPAQMLKRQGKDYNMTNNLNNFEIFVLQVQ